MKQTILIEIHTKWWNAETQYAINTAICLRNENREVFLAVRQNCPFKKKIKSADLPYIKLPQNPFAKIAKLHRVISDNSIACVISFQSEIHAIFVVLKKFFFSPLRIFRVRASPIPPKKNFLNRWIYQTKNTEQVISVNDKIFESLQFFGRTAENHHKIYFCNPPLVASKSKKEALLAKFNFPNHAKIFCLLGRNQAVKGHIQLLEALKSISIPEEVYFLFLIKDLEEFPQELSQIKQAIEKISPEKIRIVGWVEKLSEVIQMSEFGLITSQGSEAICRVMLEFMSLSVPVIATPVGSIPEMIEHRKDGLLFDSATSESMASGLKAFFQISAKEREQLAQEAFKTYQEKFTMNPFQLQWLQLFP